MHRRLPRRLVYNIIVDTHCQQIFTFFRIFVIFHSNVFQEEYLLQLNPGIFGTWLYLQVHRYLMNTKHQSPHRICGDCKHIYHISYTYITNQTVTADCFQSYHQVYQVQTAYQLQIVQSLPAVLDHPLIKTLHLLQQSQLTLQQLLLPWR